MYTGNVNTSVFSPPLNDGSVSFPHMDRVVAEIESLYALRGAAKNA